MLYYGMVTEPASKPSGHFLVISIFLLSLVPLGWAGADRIGGIGIQNEPSSIAPFLLPGMYSRVLGDREIDVHAKLSEPQPGDSLRVYSFYAAMVVGASQKTTRRILTDYPLYSQMIPYVDRTDFHPDSHILEVEGGIWKFKMKSSIFLQEKSERWLLFRVVGGHFKGLEGNVFFLPEGIGKTAVYFAGSQTHQTFPPRFVIERGAEIVFGFTAKRMRSYIESKKNAPDQGVDQNGTEIPQPRSHL